MINDMTTENFAYWMQGFVELTDGQDRPTEKQWTLIKRHLDLVFENVTKLPKEVPVIKLDPAKNKKPYYCSTKPTSRKIC